MTDAPAYLWPASVPGPGADGSLAAGPMVTRRAHAADAPGIHALIMANLAEGHLLPRTLGNVTALADRFTVVESRGVVLACGELAPLSSGVAEVRSLVVHAEARGLGLGRVVVDNLRRRARAARFRTLCAFTHGPHFFVKLGFSIVPHSWLPEKVASDCWNCTKFPHCGQYAMVASVADVAGPAAVGQEFRT